jgi:glycosyltransferase involved in cell wall biosynthesis
MNITLVTDAWEPQVNGVVTTLKELATHLEAQGHTMRVIHPGLFKTRPCPGYAGIDLAVMPRRRLREILQQELPEVLHIATEGPLGWAARAEALKNGWAFTTAFHTKFPEFVNAAIKVPVSWGYALMRHFHRPSSGVMVPTSGVLRMLEQRGFKNLRQWTHGVDAGLFEFHDSPLDHPDLAGLPRPIALFVGRVSCEKNIEAFLQSPMGGSKVVCGVGPVEAELRKKYPQVKWLGVLPRHELARVYAAADVFAFPSCADTFGLVMVEAMASGTPVAAYPVDGPLQVLERKLASGRPMGGCLHEDLAVAMHQALQVPRSEARARALDFSWAETSRLFLSDLVPTKVSGQGNSHA